MENTRKKISKLPIPESNCKAILDFSDFCFSEGLSTRRVVKYLYTLAVIAKWLPKEFVKVKRPDIEKLVNKIELNNIKISEKEDSEMSFSQKKCTRCSLDNPPANKFCSRCGMILDEKSAHDLMTSSVERARADNIMDSLLKDPEFRDMLKKKLQQNTITTETT